MTVRVRLTALYGGLVLVTGAALLAVVYLLVSASIDSQPIGLAGMTEPANTSGPGGERALAEFKQQRDAEENRLRAEMREHTLHPLLTEGLAALGGLTVAGLAAGWFAAGRTLRPIQRITTTARHVADRNLHERIGLGGPHDEMRELADTFDAMLARLDAAFEAQRHFVGNASHELKTPLAINRTLLEVAMNRRDASPDLRRLGETLLAVTARHENLVDGLLTLARSEHTVLRPVPVDLADVTAEVLEHIRDEAARHQVSVSGQTPPAVVDGDPMLLERLVQNLVQNAVRHNKPGGWVAVRTEFADGRALIEVSNTGPVLSNAGIPALFEPFARVAGRVGSTRGTGLGLSIVRSVVRAHGGEVEATARTGGGLVVAVTLPAA